MAASPISAPRSARPDGAEIIEAEGAVLCPGLVDLRASLGEPGFEYRETIASAAQAAAAGGITTIAVLPDSKPALDDPALVRQIVLRGVETGSVTLLPYGAATRGCRGVELAEYGLLKDAGAIAFTDGGKTIASSRLMRRALLLCQRVRPAHRATCRGCGTRCRRCRDRGRARELDGAARHSRRGGSHRRGARHPPRPAHRWGGAFCPYHHRGIARR